MRELVVIGLGELGQLLGGLALRAQLRVTPITRGMSIPSTLREVQAGTPILVAVGEDALDEVLAALPEERKNAAILLQNGLFSAQWKAHRINPTVMIPWLLKKRGQPLLVARSTPVYGLYAELVCDLHRAGGLETEVLTSASQLAQALVDKYAFILTVNALGLLRDITLGEWLATDSLTIEALAKEAASLGARLCESEIDLARSVAEVLGAGHALAAMRARGRTAQARVLRALEQARAFGLPLPELAKAGA
jgi:hypothetical protein